MSDKQNKGAAAGADKPAAAGDKKGEESKKGDAVALAAEELVSLPIY